MESIIKTVIEILITLKDKNCLGSLMSICLVMKAIPTPIKNVNKIMIDVL